MSTPVRCSWPVDTDPRSAREACPANVGFASAVAEFGMLLRGSPSLGDASFDSLMTRARKCQGDDGEGYRAEFIQLAERAASLSEAVPPKRVHERGRPKP